MSKKPWMKFYPSDWQSEVTLKRVSRAARSLWLDILLLIHQGGDHRLHINGDCPTDRDLAAILGDDPRTVRKLIAELESAGVFSRDDQNFITSRRILHDNLKAEKDRNNGQLGGNPSLKNKGLRENGVNPQVKAQNPYTRSQIPEEGDKSPSTAEPISTPVSPPAPPEPGGDFDTASANLRKEITAAYRDAGSMAFPDTHRATIWLRQGHDPAIIVAVIREILSRKPEIRNLAYFDNPIAAAHRPPEPGHPPRPPDSPPGNRGGFSAAAREAMNELREIWGNPDDEFQQEPDHREPAEPEILPPDRPVPRGLDAGGANFFRDEDRTGRSPNVVDFGKARAYA